MFKNGEVLHRRPHVFTSGKVENVHFSEQYLESEFHLPEIALQTRTASEDQASKAALTSVKKRK